MEETLIKIAKELVGILKGRQIQKFGQQLSEFFGGERAVTNEEYKQAIVKMQKLRAETLEKERENLKNYKIENTKKQDEARQKILDMIPKLKKGTDIYNKTVYGQYIPDKFKSKMMIEPIKEGKGLNSKIKMITVQKKYKII